MYSRLAISAFLAALAAVLSALPAQAAPLVGLTQDGRLVTFDSANPQIIVGATPPVGPLAATEVPVAIDFRPATEQLYLLTDDSAGHQGRVYVADPTTGALDPLTTAPFPVNANVSVGFDFDPTVDRIRLVTDLGQNMRLTAGGGLIAVDNQINPQASVTGIAHDHNLPGAANSTLFGLEVFPNDRLVRIGDFGGAPLPPGSGILNPIGPFGGGG